MRVAGPAQAAGAIGVLRRPLSEEKIEEAARLILESAPSLAAHAETELGIDPNELTSPTVAAVSSAVAFTFGSALPVLSIVLAPPEHRIIVTVVAVVVALVLTGFLSARVSGTGAVRAILRVVLGGLLAMGVTYWIGRLVGHNLG